MGILVPDDSFEKYLLGIEDTERKNFGAIGEIADLLVSIMKTDKINYDELAKRVGKSRDVVIKTLGNIDRLTVLDIEAIGAACGCEVLVALRKKKAATDPPILKGRI